MKFDSDDFKPITDRLDTLERMIMFFGFTAGMKTVVDVPDIAKLEGCSLSELRSGKRRYLLPRFGESAYPESHPRWTLEEYLTWRKRDPKQRQKEYEAYLLNEKKKYAAKHK